MGCRLQLPRSCMKVTDKESAKEQIKKLYKMFSEADTTLVEVGSLSLDLGCCVKRKLNMYF